MNEQADASIHPLSAIADQFKSVDNESEAGVDHRKIRDFSNDKEGGQAMVTSIPLLKISSPALLVDQNMQIVWQNHAAWTMLWRFEDPDTALNDGTSVFDLLFDTRFQGKVANWKQWLRFFIHQARNRGAAQELAQTIQARPEEQRHLMRLLMQELGNAATQASTNINLHQILEGHGGSLFNVAITRFGNKSLMVFEARPDSEAVESHRDQYDNGPHRDMMLQLLQPSRRSISVLAAALNQIDTLRTEMLDEEFSHLLMRVWQLTGRTVEEFGGIVSQAGARSLQGFFLDAADASHNAAKAIQCALELKRRMTDIGREWKIRKSWLHDIELNMGIHSGDEYMASVTSALGNHMLALGETVELASWLSMTSANGQIWATKTTIQRMPEKDSKQLRFGIFRSEGHRQVFVARCFSRIGDLSLPGGAAPHPNPDMAVHAVTQLFDRQGQG